MRCNSLLNHTAKVGIFYVYSKKTNKILTTIKLVFFCTKFVHGFVLTYSRMSIPIACSLEFNLSISSSCTLVFRSRFVQ